MQLRDSRSKIDAAWSNWNRVARSGLSTDGGMFLRNPCQGVVSIDLLTTASIAFERLYALAILGHRRREIINIAVTRHPTAE